MKRIIFFMPSFLFLASNLMGQDYSMEFGKVTNAELSMTSYDQDKEADAVVLYDIGESKFFETPDHYIRMSFERKTKIKILKKPGISTGEISIPYYIGKDDLEKVTDIEAVSYNLENGNKTTTSLDPANIFEEKISGHWRHKKFAIPNVKEGSVIEYRYSIESPFFVFLRNWSFQWEIPVIYSQYIVRMTPFYEYKYLLQGAKGFDSYSNRVEPGAILNRNSDGQFGGKTNYDDMVHTYVMKNVPAFKDESFITTPDDYLIKVNFQLSKINYPTGGSQNYLTTWPDLCNELIKNTYFGRYLSSCAKESQPFLNQLQSVPDSAEQKAEKLVGLVKANFTWNGINTLFTDQKPSEFVRTKTGNSAEINLFLIALLKQAGFTSSPVILSTRNNGRVRSDYPYVDFFNYVLAMVDLSGKQYLFDATSPRYPNNEIPVKCLNDKGLIVEKNSQQWINLRNFNYPSSVYYQFVQRISRAGDSIESMEKIKAEGIDAADLRDQFPDEKSFNGDSRYSGSQIDSLQLLDVNVPEKPFTISFNKRSSAEAMDNKIFISPFLNEPESQNMFIETDRKLPIDLVYASVKKYYAEIIIPEGYSASYLPKPLHEDDDFVRIDYTNQVQGNKLVVSGSYFFKHINYSADKYNSLRYHMNQVIKTFNDKVVLEKN